MTKVIVLIYEGFEEIEAMSVIDILRRAGLDVTTVGVGGILITSGHGVRINTDTRLIDLSAENYNVLVIPGGPGYRNILNNNSVLELVEEFGKKGKLIGAICAAPLVLAKAGLLREKRATVYPGFEKELDMPRGDRVVVDGNIITSQGPGTAIEFALKLVEQICGQQKAMSIRREIVA